MPSDRAIAQAFREAVQADIAAGHPNNDYAAIAARAAELDAQPRATEEGEWREIAAEAFELLRIAERALHKLRLDDLGSDCSLSHEVRMFSRAFSYEGRDGPGDLQVRGTGRAQKLMTRLKTTAPTPAADEINGQCVRLLDRDSARLALFQAINSITVGNKTDDKLILDQLHAKGLWIAAFPRPYEDTTPAADVARDGLSESTIRGVLDEVLEEYDDRLSTGAYDEIVSRLSAPGPRRLAAVNGGVVVPPEFLDRVAKINPFGSVENAEVAREAAALRNGGEHGEVEGG